MGGRGLFRTNLGYRRQKPNGGASRPFPSPNTPEERRKNSGREDVEQPRAERKENPKAFFPSRPKPLTLRQERESGRGCCGIVRLGGSLPVLTLCRAEALGGDPYIGPGAGVSISSLGFHGGGGVRVIISQPTTVCNKIHDMASCCIPSFLHP